MTVNERFTALLNNIALTDAQRDDGNTKHHGVRTCLNSAYYNSNSETANSMLIGSWGKLTRIRPPRDIDVFFELPYEVYQRFEGRTGNKQSQLLQEVRDVLKSTYSTTAIRGDGQVVVVPFQTFSVEVVPAFKLTSGQYWICDTHDGGKYKSVDPNAEIKAVSDSDTTTKANTRHLIRMLKCWQGWCSVPIKSFVLELLAIQFLQTWQHAGKSITYYDWMTRDFLLFLKGKYSWESVSVPGTFESIVLGDAWKSRAESAYDRAVKACDHDNNSRPLSAGEEWQKIFGTYIPIS